MFLFEDGNIIIYSDGSIRLIIILEKNIEILKSIIVAFGVFYIDKLDNGIIVGHNGGSFHTILKLYSYKNGNLEFQKKSVEIFPKEHIHLDSLYGINENEIIIVYGLTVKKII